MTEEKTEKVKQEPEVQEVEKTEAPKQPKTLKETPAEEINVEELKGLVEKLRQSETSLKKKVERFEEQEAERKKAEMTDLERLQAERDEALAQNEKMRRTFVQRDIAEELGLPLELAERIKGETPEDMRTDAEKLLEIVPKSKKAPQLKDTTPPDMPKGTMTDDERRKFLFG